MESDSKIDLAKFIAKLTTIVGELRGLQALWNLTPSVEELAEAPDVYHLVEELDDWRERLTTKFMEGVR